MRRATYALVLGLSLVASVAAAQPTAADKARAKEAYDRGVEAHKRGEMQKAAEEFARADALAPSAVALQAALDAAVDADDPALGAELVERSSREPVSGALGGSVQTARTKFAGRTGRLRVLCPAASKCLAKLDDRFIDVDKAVWAKTGAHTVVIQVDGDAQTKLVELKAEQMLDVVPTSKSQPPPLPSNPTPTTDPTKPPPATPVDKDKDKDKPRSHVMTHGLPRIVFFGGIGATVLLGALTTGLAIDTKNKHKSFVNAGCNRANFIGCEDKQEEGERAQELTNVSLAATAILGVATLVVGIAFTDWQGPVLTAVPNGVIGGWSRRF